MMRKLMQRLLLLLSALVMATCTTEKTIEGPLYQCPMECEGEKTYSDEGRCPVCKMYLTEKEEGTRELADESIPETSIFNLTSQWKTEENETIVLSDLKGEVLVVVMIYTSCKAACPRLVADMRNIHAQVGEESVRYVLVSIDPEVDTPERLKKFAIENQMDSEQWVFLQGSIDDVREFSNVLSMKYKRISPLDFSHSNIISVFDKSGVLVHQQEGLGLDNKNLVDQVLSIR